MAMELDLDEGLYLFRKVASVEEAELRPSGDAVDGVEEPTAS